ncbi:MAG: hypothetical protein K2Y33_14715 [Mycolicibacterium frederiksbergense]|uniref:hypothetical protein n=1 Tax=Mycobacterium adipatum TaxID=1682113 RepID=UPI0027F63418|nr:hypothetical protein [Mycolicibacterium frederiksbergense]
MPPALWNARSPTGGDAPTAIAAGNDPLAISIQKQPFDLALNCRPPGDLILIA